MDVGVTTDGGSGRLLDLDSPVQPNSASFNTAHTSNGNHDHKLGRQKFSYGCFAVLHQR